MSLDAAILRARRGTARRDAGDTRAARSSTPGAIGGPPSPTVCISALITPIEGLRITPAFFYEKLVAGGLPYIDSVPGTSAHDQPFEVAESVKDEFKLGGLKLVYQTDAFEIDSNSA